MYNIIDTNLAELATRLAKKYEADKDYMSVGSTEPWLPCYRDIGTYLLEIEHQTHSEDKLLRSLSRQLAENFSYTAPYRFSPKNLLRMKEYASSFARNPDLLRWEATHQPNWHGLMPSNFQITLPQQMKDAARSIFKNSYRIPLPTTVQGGDLSKLKESDLEKALVDNITEAKAQLGPDFGYWENQYNAPHEHGTYKFDLLFYQHTLRSHIIIELKIGAFKANYIEKMEKYLQCAEWELRTRDDEAPIGIFLCREMDEIQVEQLLRHSHYPIGVATYRF